jgi:hypothetical protein
VTPWAVVGIAVGGLSVTAAASTAPSATPLVGSTTRTVALVTGDQVTAVTAPSGQTSYALRSAAGAGPAETYRDAAGDQYVVPAVAQPYLGRQLDRSLFDVSALLRAGLAAGARVPVALTFATGVTPSAPPGVTLTAVSGESASGYVTASSGAAFGAALRARIGADVKAGHPAGTGALFGGLTGLSLATGITVTTVTPHYPLHIVQLNETDATGKPIAFGDAYVVNMDQFAKGLVDVPIGNGVGRVAMPAGHYLVMSIAFDYDASGNATSIHWVSRGDITVPTTSGVTTTVALDERAATSEITVSTPRPATAELQFPQLFVTDATGLTSGFGLIEGGATPIYLSPLPAPKIGAVHLLVHWGGTGPTTGPAYRYDVAFAATGIPADESYVARPNQLATTRQSYFGDPAGGSTAGYVYNIPVDATALSTGVLFGAGVGQTMPADVTEYLGTADGGVWSQEITTGGFGAFIYADDHTFAPGRSYAISWAHGPLAATLGQHTGLQFCEMCSAGASLTVAFNPIGDSEPDHVGAFSAGTDHFTLYRDGVTVFDADASDGVELKGIATTPATYRAVYTHDLTGATGYSQSTKVLTDLTVNSTHSVALPSASYCYGQSTSTPCEVLPALTLNYRLDTNGDNTSAQPIQLLNLGVGHVGYDGAESHAAITSATVSVSFDGGKTWHPATVYGAAGAYVAAWANPASAHGTSPELKVSATDAIGGKITQTIVNAYTIAK